MRKMSNNNESSTISIYDLNICAISFFDNQIIPSNAPVKFLSIFLKNVKLPFTLIWYALPRRLGEGVNRFDSQ